MDIHKSRSRRLDENEASMSEHVHQWFKLVVRDGRAVIQVCRCGVTQ